MFDKIAERLLQESIKRGEFDDLPNKGQSIDLTQYFNTPEEFRAAASVLKNAGVTPPEVELLREIAELKNQLASCSDNDKQAKLRERIQYLQIEFNIAMERIQQQRKKR